MAARKRFKRERKQYDLTFEDGDLDGFECVLNGVSLDEFLEVAALEGALSTMEGRTRENIERQFTVLAEHMVSWNLDGDDDQPVPCVYAELRALDFDFALAIFRAWMRAMHTVPDDLGKDSSSGATSPEASLGLGRQSQNLAS